MSVKPVLRADGVTKSFGDVTALHEVSFSIASGEFVAILGSNGAGKTTLLQLLTGLFVPDSGEIVVMEKNMRRNAVQALADIGVVFQQQTLDLELSVSANLLFHADLHGLSRLTARKRIVSSLDQYGLTDRATARARSLSGGNRRRIELARALLHRPRILLMDEATVGLDPESRHLLLKEMRRLTAESGMSILWATHLVDELEHVDRVLMLDKGRLIYDGTVPGLSDRLAGKISSMFIQASPFNN